MNKILKKTMLAIVLCGTFGVLKPSITVIATDAWGGFEDGTNREDMHSGVACNAAVTNWVNSRGYTRAANPLPYKVDLTGNTAYRGSDPKCTIYYVNLKASDKNVEIYAYLDASGKETGYGVKADCNNIVRYTPKPPVESGWEIKTGSWSQANSTRTQPDGSWNAETTVKEADKYIYFTHSAAVAKKNNEILYPNSDRWKDAKSNIKIDFSKLSFMHDGGSGNGTFNQPVPNTEVVKMFGDTAACGPHSTSNWWAGEGWSLEGALPNMGSFTKTGTHWGLGPGGGVESQNYLCEIELTSDRRAAINAFGKNIAITSTITIDPTISDKNSSLGAGVVKGVGGKPYKGDPVTSSARVIINATAQKWSVNVMSYVKVDRNGGPSDTISGCNWGDYCAGKVGIGSDSVFNNASSRNPIDGPPTIISAKPDCVNPDGTLNDDSKCVDIDVNFKHTVTVSGDNTGSDKTKKQLWFYAISNENTQTDFSSNGCIGSGINGGSRFQQRTPALSWHAIVLEKDKTYDILASGTPTATSVGGAKALCANDIKNDKIKKGAWRSVLYLCFATSTAYEYKYGTESEISADAGAAKTACENSMTAHNVNDSAWTAANGTDGVVVTSHAVAAYEPTPGAPQTCDNDPNTPLPDCSEIAISKTQTCAVNDGLGQHKCDPEGTAPPAPGQPDEFKALDPNAKKEAITQLARPGDDIKFVHNFDKAAQKLAKDTTWKTLPGFSPSKCHTSTTYSSKSGMDTADRNCTPNAGLLTPFEVQVQRSHSEDEARKGESAYKATDAGPNKTYAVRDDCFYTGIGTMFSAPNAVNQGKISYHNIKAPTGGLLNNLQGGAVGNQCNDMDGNGKLHEESAVAKVMNGDVGTKEIYQRATLFDRVAQKLQNLKIGEGKQPYQTNTGGSATSPGEDSEHKYDVKWEKHYTCSSCRSGCCSDCSGCCCSGRTVYGSPHGTNCGSSGCYDGSADGFGTYTEWEHTWVDMVDAGPVSSNAQFHIPYNYQIVPRIDTSKFPAGRMLHGGSELDYQTWFNILAVGNAEFGENYATLTRPGTHWEVTEFYIDENVTSDPNPGDRHDTSAPCSSYIHANHQIQNVNRNCYTKASGTGSLNTINGANHTGSGDARNGDTGHSVLTATINDAPPGTKFCVGVSVYDEYSFYGNNDSTYGDAVKGNWIHLKPECISISKIPTMQIWSGGLYAENEVLGKYATKIPAPFLDAWKAFGSWSEYDAIGSSRFGTDATLRIFGSAAAFGRGLEVGGVTNQGIINGCDFIKLNIKNKPSDCKNPSNSDMGKSQAFRGLAQRVTLRYTNRVQVPAGKTGRWVTGDSTKIDSVAGGAVQGQDYDDWNASSSITPKSGEVTYYRASGNATITGTNIDKGKTVIVEVDGTATIDGNITYTSAPLASIHDIPQVIIFAQNIDINPHVTQVDAWLMVGLKGGNGVVNTCNKAGINENTLIAVNEVYTDCNYPLKINGPVQAKKLRLLRSYGAGMGLDCNYAYKDGIGYTNNAQAQWPNGGRTNNCGSKWYGTGEFPYDSASPAEVFNLRADAYLWAYHQVENYSQAFVTYAREVAPRF
ncbi:MAG: hypothetical protein LBQ02_01295 [Candidatus Nomurabacteria bacterium]|jgi:hypothetical protein|nr:hypothetical protein [Candidatus Nomurabacteria bacterium]